MGLATKGVEAPGWEVFFSCNDTARGTKGRGTRPGRLPRKELHYTKPAKYSNYVQILRVSVNIDVRNKPAFAALFSCIASSLANWSSGMRSLYCEYGNELPRHQGCAVVVITPSAVVSLGECDMFNPSRFGDNMI